MVGAGLAGHAAAERLSEDGFASQLTIVGQERHRPYNRTPLSKQLPSSAYDVPDPALPAFTPLDATRRLNTRAVKLDPARRVLTLPGAEQLSYDGLVLARGVEARVLPGTPLHSGRVRALRTLDDARDIEKNLSHASRRVAVVGGGFIGCKLASTCRAHCLDVTIVDTTWRPQTPVHGGAARDGHLAAVPAVQRAGTLHLLPLAGQLGVPGRGRPTRVRPRPGRSRAGPTDTKATSVHRHADPHRPRPPMLNQDGAVTGRGAVWSAPLAVFFPDGPEDPNVALLRVTPVEGEIWDGPSLAIGRAVAFARTYASNAQTPPGDDVKLEFPAC